MNSERATIEIQGVWKVFGKDPGLVLKAISKKGLSKKEVLEYYNAVLGVADVSLSISSGEIFCIMGLSGSG